MSSKDLNGMQLLPAFLDAQIDSLKVEGRMKGHLYAATISVNYARALNEYRKNKKVSRETLLVLGEELKKISHRDYTTASLLTPAGPDSVYQDRENSEGEYAAVGVVVDQVKNDSVVVEIKKAFLKEETLEFMLFNGEVLEVVANEIGNLNESETYENESRYIGKIKTDFDFPIHSYGEKRESCHESCFLSEKLCRT